MATFQETVVALNPLRFWRGKELGVPTEVADYSGNDEPLPVTGAGLIFGQSSGVETDSEARSIYIPDGFANNIGDIPLPPPELQFDGNFTIAAFIKHEEIGGSRYILARGGVAGGVSTGLHFFTNGSDTRELVGRIVTTDGVVETTHTVTAETAHLNDVWNFAVFRRNGAVIDVWINAVLVGQDSASTDPLLVDGNDDLVFGAAGNNLAPFKGWLAELIICDFAWTEAQMLEVYESAIASIFLRGRSDVVVSATLNSAFEPDPVSFPFRHNWSEPLVERLSWRSAISTARTGAEEANAQRVKPRREVEFSQLLKSNTERRKFRALLWANQTNKWFIPLRQYTERLLAPLSSGATTTPIDTQHKDYEVDSWIGFRQLNDDGSIRHWEERAITGLNPLVHEATTSNYERGAEVYPVKRAYLSSSQSLTGHTDTVEEATITARILDDEATPNRLTVWAPATKYRDHELFNPFLWPNNWIESRDWEVERASDDVDFDTGIFAPEADTLSATESFSWRVLIEGYESIAQFLGWCYERRGAWRYLWVPSMQEDFKWLSRSGVNLTVEDTNYSDGFALGEPRRDLAFVYFDNTIILRRVAGFSGTVNETLELDESVPTFTNLRLICLLRFCRMDGDQIELTWHTNDTLEATWRFRDLTHSPEGTGSTSLSPSVSLSPSLSASTSPSISPSASQSPSASLSPSASESPSPSASESVSASASASPSISPSGSVSPSASDSPTPSASASLSPSSSVSSSLSPSPSVSPSASPSPST